MKQVFLSILIILIVSCSENGSRDKSKFFTDPSTIKAQRIIKDSITIVDICYFPSFTNSSVLRLNRMKDEGVFTVDTFMGFNFGKPDTLKFLLNDMESKTDIESFWSSSFIHSIRQDTSKLGLTDGMTVVIIFNNNRLKDTVYLGNVYSKTVDSLLMRQIQYLEKMTNNRAMKIYLKQLKEYL